jgi:hypothetical protein
VQTLARVILIAILLFLIPGVASAATIGLVTTGDPAPDANGQHLSFAHTFPIPINRFAVVGFRNDLSLTSSGTDDDTGIFRATDTQVSQAARENGPTDDPAAKFRDLLDTFPHPVAVNAASQLAFRAPISDGNGSIETFVDATLRHPHRRERARRGGLFRSPDRNQIASITGNGVDLYYDPDHPENAYLAGGTFPLAGGGEIVPLPEPSPYLSWPAGLVALVLLARRRAGPSPSDSPKSPRAG